MISVLVTHIHIINAHIKETLITCGTSSTVVTSAARFRAASGLSHSSFGLSKMYPTHNLQINPGQCILLIIDPQVRRAKFPNSGVDDDLTFLAYAERFSRRRKSCCSGSLSSGCQNCRPYQVSSGLRGFLYTSISTLIRTP
jgi:hypothetical protein